MGNFKVVGKDGNARAGVLKTPHGEIETPVFMPVGTQGTVKALTPEDLTSLGTQIILGNTYHLYLRPGHKLIKKLGGLHKFMHWDGPILTDSGGFQAFSLGAAISHGVKKVATRHSSLVVSNKNKKRETSKRDNDAGSLVTQMTEEGVHFVSHLDGSRHLLTPELSMEVQLDLGSDICLTLDELLSPLHDMDYVKQSLERTHRWELRSLEYFKKHVGKGTTQNALIFGILQGIDNEEIRKGEAKWIASQDFDGISIGGSFGVSAYQSVGEPERVEWADSHAIDKTMSWVVPLLPDSWARHALGIGEVLDLFECIERGVDMFDCVAPMRRARNGSLYISPKTGGKIANESHICASSSEYFGTRKNKYVLSISRSEFKEDKKPIDLQCQCYTCQNYSWAYLRHLYMAKELLYYHLATIHNVYFIVNLVKQIRESILNNQFSKLKKTWV